MNTSSLKMHRVYFPSPQQIRYTAFRDRPLQERQAKFLAALREGHTEIVSANYSTKLKHGA